MSGINTLTAIGNGLAANDGTGDALRSGAAKINGNNAAIVTAVNNLAASQSAGRISYLTKADMDADLAHGDGTMADVTNDDALDNNTTYRKSGASGAGSWEVTVNPTSLLKSDLASTATGKGSEQIGFQQVSADAAVRTMADKAREIVSVDDFGADATGAFYCAEHINTAMASGAKVVNLRRGGVYKLEKEIRVPSGVRFSGNGARLITDQPIIHMVINEGIDQPNYDGGDNIVIEDIVFDGQGQTLQCGGVALAHTTNSTIQNCTFKDFNSTEPHAIDLPGNQFLTVRGCLFSNFSGATTLQVDAASAGSMNTTEPPDLNYDPRVVCADILITGNKFVNCGGSSYETVHLHKKGHTRITITDNFFLNCYRAVADDLGSTYRANGPTTDILVRGNTVQSTYYGGGVYLDYVKRVTICDNIIQTAGGAIGVLNYYPPKPITGVSQANPGVVTCANTFANGDVVLVRDVVGMTQLNNRYYTVASATAASFTLVDLGTGVSVDTSGYTAYSSGGTATYKSMPSTARNEEVKISGNTISASHGSGIIIENCANASVCDNSISAYGEDDDYSAGIKFDSVFPLRCSGNTIDSDNTGSKYAVELRRCYRYKISENVLSRGLFGVYVDRLNASDVSRGLICGNTILTGTTYPVYVKASSTNPAVGLGIHGNLINGQFSGNCIRVENATAVTITGNILQDVKTTSTGFSLSLCTRISVTGNTLIALSGNTAGGIGIFGSGSAGRASVVGNVIENFATGVTISGSGADYGVVSGNTFIGVTTPTTVASNVVVGDNCTV